MIVITKLLTYLLPAFSLIISLLTVLQVQYTGPAKKVTPRKNSISLELWYIFSPNLQRLQKRLQATHCANCVAIFGCIPNYNYIWT